MVLDGMVPVLTQTPPTTDRDSTTATRFFILEAATAARCPEGPEPMTIRSYLAALIRVSPESRLRDETWYRTRRWFEAYQAQHTLQAGLARSGGERKPCSVCDCLNPQEVSAIQRWIVPGGLEGGKTSHTGSIWRG